MTGFSEYWDAEQLRRLAGSYSASKKRHDTIADYIQRRSTSSPSNNSVLNIGLGNGYLEAVLLGFGFKVFCLDPSENAVKALQEKLRLEPGSGRAGSVDAIPFADCQFDYVVMSEVIEHLDELTLQKGMTEVQRVLKLGGVFLGTVPCNEDLDHEMFQCPSCMKNFHRVGHVKSYIPESMRDLLAVHFEVLTSRRFVGMYLNWKGKLLHQWNDFPFKIVRLFRPHIRAPHQIQFNIFFAASKRHSA
jgi:SAM-dependent methyltransferase